MFMVKCIGDFGTHDEIYEFTCKTAEEAYKALSSTCRWFTWNEALRSFGYVYDQYGRGLCTWSSDID